MQILVHKKPHTHTKSFLLLKSLNEMKEAQKKHNKRTHTLRMSNRIVNEFVFSLVVVFFILFLVKIIIVKYFCVTKRDLFNCVLVYIVRCIQKKKKKKLPWRKDIMRIQCMTVFCVDVCESARSIDVGDRESVSSYSQ